VCQSEAAASFARYRRSTLSSFPRSLSSADAGERESTPQTFGKVPFYGLDSRLRGNDRWFVREVIPNDATTQSDNDVAQARIDTPFLYSYAEPWLPRAHLIVKRPAAR